MFTLFELCVQSLRKCQNLGDMLFISEALLKCFEKWKMEGSINLLENRSQIWFGLIFFLEVEETWKWAGKV